MKLTLRKITDIYDCICIYENMEANLAKEGTFSLSPAVSFKLARLKASLSESALIVKKEKEKRISNLTKVDPKTGAKSFDKNVFDIEFEEFLDTIDNFEYEPNFIEADFIGSDKKLKIPAKLLNSLIPFIK